MSFLNLFRDAIKIIDYTIFVFKSFLFFAIIVVMQTTKTPAMLQYFEIKKENPDCLLLFRMGDFYELFGDDAITSSKILNITLTSRDRTDNKLPMAGFPYHALDNYLQKLIDANYKVGIVEQMDTEGNKGIMRRELIKIVTPGLNVTSDINNRENNFLFAVKKFGKNLYALSFIDFTVGDFYIFDPLTQKQLKSYISLIQPKEILYTEDKLFDINTSKVSFFKKDILYEHFNISTFKGFGFNDDHLSLMPAGAIIKYIKDTQKTDISHIRVPRLFRTNEYMFLDENTINSLEIFKTIKDNINRGSLFEIIDKTYTSLGFRKLKFFLSYPLLSIDLINERLDAVSEIIKSKDREVILENLKNIVDIQRLSTRISLQSISPRDLISLKESLQYIQQITPFLQKFKSQLIKNIYKSMNDSKIGDLISLINKYIIDNPPMLSREGGFIKEGINKDLDKYRDVLLNGKNWILNLQKEEAKRLNISSLKIQFNKVFGFYIEIPNAHKNKVPQDYIRKQTLVSSERFISPELKEHEEMIVNAESRALLIENEIFISLRKELLNFIDVLQILGDNIGILDVLMSFSITAIDNNFSRPIFNIENDNLEIVDGRHPVIEKMIFPLPYIPNSIKFDKDQKIIIITGPNMSGKSSILRQTAIISILAQIGSFVPAKSAKLPLIDRIFTRVGARDNLSQGESTFMVEMLECANIINNATDKSLIILDEVGRGTSTYDGVSIAWALIEYIHDFINAKTLFATHYTELLQLENILTKVVNFHVEVDEKNQKIVFLRHLVKGGTDKSYGVHVASIAGLPDSLIKRAFAILNDFEKNRSEYKGSLIQQNLFDSIDDTSPIKDFISSIDLNNITPMEALEKLFEVKEIIEND